IGLLNLMAKLRDEEGVSILYITHDIASARYVADRPIVMYAGQIAETGPIAASRPGSSTPPPAAGSAGAARWPSKNARRSRPNWPSCDPLTARPVMLPRPAP